MSYQDARWGSLTSLQSWSCCVLQPQLTGPPDTRWGSLTPLQRCSRCYSTAPAQRAIGISLGESYPSAEIQSVLFYSPSRMGYRALVGGVLPLCRDAVAVILQPQPNGPPDTRWGSLTLLQRCSKCYSTAPAECAIGHSLGESYPSTEMQSVLFYSLSPQNNINFFLLFFITFHLKSLSGDISW